MNYADAFDTLLHSGADSLWRAVRAMPAEKLDWKPAPEARNARELVEEIVMTTGFSAEFIHTQKMPDMEHSETDKKGLDELEKEHRAALEKLVEAIRAFPEDKLSEKVELPWGTSTWLEVISYPYWNLMYHYGQISYIQTMYGDKETR